MHLALECNLVPEQLGLHLDSLTTQKLLWNKMKARRKVRKVLAVLILCLRVLYEKCPLLVYAECVYLLLQHMSRHDHMFTVTHKPHRHRTTSHLHNQPHTTTCTTYCVHHRHQYYTSTGKTPKHTETQRLLCSGE